MVFKKTHTHFYFKMSQMGISCAYAIAIPFFFLLEESQFVLVFHLSILLQEGRAHTLSHFNCVPFFCNPMDCSPLGSSVLGFSSQEYWSVLPCSPSGTFPTRGSNQCLLHLLHDRQILYPLRHLGSPLQEVNTINNLDQYSNLIPLVSDQLTDDTTHWQE